MRLGSHICGKKAFPEIIKYMNDLNMPVGQIYLNTNKKNTIEAFAEAYELASKTKTQLFIHAPIMMNPSGGKTLNPEDAPKRKQYLRWMKEELTSQLDVCCQISPEGGVVLHIGFCEDRQEGIKRVIATLKDLFKVKPQFEFHTPRPRNLLLENAAGQGTALGVQLEELVQIAREVPEVNFCIDTCHLFAAGEYDISDGAVLIQYFEDFDKKIGLKRLKLIHLNDSKKEFGCRVDRHANLRHGMIWGKSDDSLNILFQLCELHDIPLVLETPGALLEYHSMQNFI